ncbi:MAG: arsenate reductase [Granulosicoccus sp.]
MIKIYGIKNCDTVKKTLRWFAEQNVTVDFIDFKKEPPTAELIQQWIALLGWESLVNKRGTTWRKLPETTKTSVDSTSAVALIQHQPSLIKRPLIELQGHLWIGFDLSQFAHIISRES